MDREKASFEKKSLLLEFFHTHQPEPKDRLESKCEPESKGRSAKGRLLPAQKKLTDWDTQLLPLIPTTSNKEDQTEEVDFITHTKEVSFDDFLKFRANKKIL